MDKDIDVVIIEEAQKAIVRRLTPEKIAEVKEIHSEMVDEFKSESVKILTDLRNKPTGVLVTEALSGIDKIKERLMAPEVLGETALLTVGLSGDFLDDVLSDITVDLNLVGAFTNFNVIDNCDKIGMSAEEIAHQERLVVEDVEEYLESKK
ncbi:hypothetical protein MOC16_gp228 [Klebsiella phage vB_KpM_FBKp24]|uniref:Uncharacterized protein n=1 Tax=Klebsiella phage vB_KpM_FBKp24 TaxID=2801834 RepID=A0A7U0J5I2_9CAUD|nr:hypothetical protein [Klebsiella pneumoniae]YP_010298822.1 hypothetical protein MOC16_gp228 [Klebsiella phage vB_KpM_FBKp24]QQV92204.1 hypothetical protein vBKpMFBKp24_185 [Klebsiella phage vB_KpM_FBKp24]